MMGRKAHPNIERRGSPSCTATVTAGGAHGLPLAQASCSSCTATCVRCVIFTDLIVIVSSIEVLQAGAESHRALPPLPAVCKQAIRRGAS